MCVFLFCYGLAMCSMEGTQLWKESLEQEVLGPARSVILLERVSGKYFKQILANQPWAPTQGTGQHVTCCICRSVEGKKGGMGWLEEYKKKKRHAKRSAPYCLRILRCQLWHMDMNLYLWQKEFTRKAHWGFNGSLCWSVISFNLAWYKKKKFINLQRMFLQSMHFKFGIKCEIHKITKRSPWQNKVISGY